LHCSTSDYCSCGFERAIAFKNYTFRYAVDQSEHMARYLGIASLKYPVERNIKISLDFYLV